jgi:hypothetical protein
MAARRLFGPGKDEVWRQLAAALGAEHVKGRFGTGGKVRATHGAWMITLDTYAVSTGHSTQVYTRIRAPFVNPLGFRFTIWRRGFFSDIAKRFGMQDIEVGEPSFDHDFIVKASDETLVRALLSHARIRELIQKQPRLDLSVKGDRRRGTSVLHFVVAGVIKDVARLTLLYQLFAEVLDQLNRMGLARSDATSV